MGQSGSARRVLEEAVLVRLSRATAAAVGAAAEAAGLSRAAWLRRLAVEAAGLPPGEARPSRPAATLARADLAAVARLIGAVGKATGATIQLARQLREGGAAGLHAEAEAMLGELRTAAAQLRRLSDRLVRGAAA